METLTRRFNLDESLKIFEQGIGLSRNLFQTLNEAEGKVEECCRPGTYTLGTGRRMITPMNLSDYLSEHSRFVDSALDEVLPSSDLDPKILHEAMRYSVFAGGKRIRPIIANRGSAGRGWLKRVRPISCGRSRMHSHVFPDT